MILPVVSGLFLLLLWPAALHPGSQPTARFDLDGYTAEIDRWSSAISQIDEHPEGVKALQSFLAGAWSVSAGDQDFTVSTGWLATALMKMETFPIQKEALRRTIQENLKALKQGALALKETSSARQSQNAAARLAAILSGFEFRAVGEDDALQSFRQKLTEWIVRLLGLLIGPVVSRPRLGRALVWLAIVIGLSLVALLLRNAWTKKSSRAFASESVAQQNDKRWRGWASAAAAAAGRNDYCESLRCAYWAGIYRLEELGKWQTDVARTPREYLRLLPDDYTESVALRALTRRFEQVWYAGHGATMSDYHEAIVNLEALGCPFPLPAATEKS